VAVAGANLLIRRLHRGGLTIGVSESWDDLAGPWVVLLSRNDTHHQFIV
jgi:hypothetical protein